jgi:hypothetical protein
MRWGAAERRRIAPAGHRRRVKTTWRGRCRTDAIDPEQTPAHQREKSGSDGSDCCGVDSGGERSDSEASASFPAEQL